MGRFLFTVFETGQSGVQRHDLHGQTDTIWFSPVSAAHVAFDASFWTPWGTLITAEEAGARPRRLHHQPLRSSVRAHESDHRARHHRAADPDEQRRGRLRSPERDPACFARRHPVRPRRQHVLHRRAERRLSLQVHVGGRWGGHVREAEYFAAGQILCCASANGNTPNATGAYTWVPFTDAAGLPCPER